MTLQNAQLIGRGFTADVYAWGHGRVLKLYQSGVASYRPEREFRVTRAVHAAGLPVPAAYDLISVEGRHGVVFERIDGISMLKRCQSRPWQALFWVRHLAELHADIHRCEGPAELPTQRERLAVAIGESVQLSDEQRNAAQARLTELPDGTALCHGDFHPENVLFTQRGPFIIDWTRASRGDPLGDVARTSSLIQNADLPPWSPRYMHLILKFYRNAMHRSYIKQSLKLHSGTPEQIKSWEVPLAAALRYWRTPQANTLSPANSIE